MQRGASAKEGTNKRRGQRVPNCKVEPGDRGHLGRTDHLRVFVEATKVWADLEEAQGHRLWRSDLLNHFRQKLDSAIAFAPEDQEKGCFDKGKAKELNAWIAKQTAMMKDKSKRDKQSA